MIIAPIGMSVYTRINHFRRSIEALQKNVLASESELFIYSDAANTWEDESLVQEVRTFAHSITGFKKIHVTEREKNYGGTKNSYLALISVSEMRKDGRSIYLEDDIVTAPGFLTFMNAALEFYKDNKHILSVTGYCPPINIPECYERDIFILPRYCGWGSGTFKRTIEIASKKITKLEFNSTNKKVFTVGGGDILHMIEREVNGEINAGDVRCMYYQALHNKYTIYPRQSLVLNIGHDGTGVHCGATDKFHHEILWDKTEGFEFVKDIQPDKRIIRANQKFRRPGLRTKVLSPIKRIHQAFKSTLNGR
ncbi:MAG: hypothetical protein R8K46_07340 [Mariprofundaceae bacterium]